MGKAAFKLGRKLKREAAQIGAAGRKRGLWGSIGMGLGGLLAIGLTGGAAAPLVAGLMSAGGTYAGGKLGDWLASKTKGGKIKGGRFFQDERASLIGTLQDKITSGALSSGLMAGFQQFKALGGLKEGGGLGKIFKSGAGKQTQGFGKLFDFRGSTIGKGIDKFGQALDLRKARKLQVGEGLATGEEFIGTGKLPKGTGGVPDLESLFQEELNMPAIEGVSTQDVYRAKVGQLTGPGEAPSLVGQNQWDAFKSSKDIIRAAPVSGEVPMYKTGLDWEENTSGWLQRQQPGGETGYTSEIPLSKRGIIGEKRSIAEEQLLRTDIEKAMDWRAAGRPGLEDRIAPSEFRGRPSVDLSSLPGRGDYMPQQRISAMEYGGVVPGYEPTSYSPGTDFTETSAWEQYTEPWSGYKPSYSSGGGGYRPSWNKRLFGDK